MHVRKTFATLSSPLLPLLVLLLSIPAAARPVLPAPAVTPAPSVVDGLQPSRTVAGGTIDSDYYTIPRELPPALRVLAIRIHFQPDTIETTFGDGDFLYDFPDTVNPDGWILDRPPHDRQFFLDHLLAARNYFEKFSDGKLTLAGVQNPGEGGDLFPLGDHESYEMPYPIWHINYGDGDNEHLNQRLVELFIDAWTAADADPDVNVSDYDLFVVFHAGAGNEFDTGYDLTPFDIPSVYISVHDLEAYGGLPDGVPMSDGFIPAGIILPETQRQPGVDVGLHGTVVAQIGFAIGLPHLYNTETGASGIGMFGLMDRGFGAYFGTIPAPPSAWSRVFMRWDTPVTIDGFSEHDTVRVGALHLPDDVFSDSLNSPDDVVRLLRLPINDNEYYLAEARRRDPDGDSLAFGWDREGRRITFHDNYSWEADPDYRVAVTYSDYDFDLPASGVLLWHIDDARIKRRYGDDTLENSFENRAIRLVEADGTWDIGNEYPFLSAGDGTEYGYYADAFFKDNDIWREANRPLFNLEFSTDTAPASIANSGGYSHISLSRFSDIGDTMSFRAVNNWVESGYPADFEFRYALDMTAGDFNGDGCDEVVLLGMTFSGAKLAIVDSAGVSPYNISDLNNLVAQTGVMAVVDMDGDGDDDLILPLNDGMAISSYQPQSNTFSSRMYQFDGAGWCFDVAIADAGDGTPYVVALYDGGDLRQTRFIAVQYDDPADEASIDTTFAGNVLLNAGGRILLPDVSLHGPDVVVWMDNLSVIQFNFTASTVNLVLPEDIETNGDLSGGILRDAVTADFSGDGFIECMGTLADGRLIHLGFTGPLENPLYDWMPSYSVSLLDVKPTKLRALDLDHDGELEPSYLNPGDREIVAVERDGLRAENTPLSLSRIGLKPEAGEALILDSDSDGNLEWFTLAEGDGGYDVVSAFDLSDGRVMPGFPLNLPGSAFKQNFLMIAANLDRDDHLELVTAAPLNNGGLMRVTVFNLPSFPGGKALVWSEPGGNPRNTRYTPLEAASDGASETFTMDGAYCWPNPVLNEDKAHFRFPRRVGPGGEVTVEAYDLAGRKVASASMTVSSGMDTEAAEIELDVAKLPSGVYVARLDVAGEVRTIRFAVVN